MSQFFLQKIPAVSRFVILFGVLAGLLFSCGEGIRLFPFPTAKTAPVNDYEYKSGTKSDYQKNIHRFKNNQVNSAAKYQRDNPPHHWANNTNALNDSPLFASAIRQAIEFSPRQKFFKSHFFLSSQGSRAPPVL